MDEERRMRGKGKKKTKMKTDEEKQEEMKQCIKVNGGREGREKAESGKINERNR